MRGPDKNGRREKRRPRHPVSIKPKDRPDPYQRKALFMSAEKTDGFNSVGNGWMR